MSDDLVMGGMGSLDEISLSGLGERFDFDLIVIGSGPAGQRGAISAAKTGARVALIEKEPLAGGYCLNTGTIPSKTLREAVVYLTGYRQRGYYGDKYHLKDKISTGDLYQRTNLVIRLERGDINDNLVSNGITRLVGRARLIGPNDVEVDLGDNKSVVRARKILVCVGTHPRRPPDIPFDEMNIFDSDAIFGRENELRPLPGSLIVLGAGVIGIEYTCMFAALDIACTLVDSRPNPLNFVDDEISELLYTALRERGTKLLFGVKHTEIKLLGEPGSLDSRAQVYLSDGSVLEADACLFALGRVPATETLDVAKAGVKTDERGYLLVDGNYCTNVPSIYAAGDVIGFPSLAATSAEQGRVAALNALGVPVTWHPASLPFGIYTIPEISMVGKTEQQLQKENIPYFVGTALFRDTARGKILGELTGALKLLFHRQEQHLLGVHVIGEGATELLHIGQAVMHFGGGPDYFINTVFNYPTLAEAYKVAALNALNRLAGKSHHTDPLPQQIYRDQHPSEWVKWMQT